MACQGNLLYTSMMYEPQVILSQVTTNENVPVMV